MQPERAVLVSLVEQATVSVGPHAPFWRLEMRQWLRAGIAVAVSTVCCMAQAGPLPDYRAVPVMTTAADGVRVVPTGINNQGSVIGVLNLGWDYHGFVERGGVTAWLPTLGGNLANAGAINHAGDIVYQSETAGGEMRATLYRDGQVIDLAPASSRSNVGAVSQSGQWMAGDMWCAACGGYNQAAVYTQGGVQSLGTLGGNSSRAEGVNDAGQVVGFSYLAGNPSPRAFLYENGLMRDLGDFGGAIASASAINQAGQIVGTADDAGGVAHAFLYENGRMIDLGTLYPGRATAATAINDSGMIVGVGTWASTTDSAFVWREGVMMDLNALLDPASGWRIDDARGINDFGQIAAHGCNAGLGVCGVLRLDPLTPVPEPASYAMLAAGLGLLGAAAQRRSRVRNGTA